MLNQLRFKPMLSELIKDRQSDVLLERLMIANFLVAYKCFDFKEQEVGEKRSGCRKFRHEQGL